MKKSKPELILEVGAAGGSISIWSVKDKEGNRSFIVARDESTLREFMSEEDAKGISFQSKTVLFKSFADALTEFERYPWYKMQLLFAHQDFIDPILAAAKKLGGKEKDDFWHRRNLELIDGLNTRKVNHQAGGSSSK